MLAGIVSATGEALKTSSRGYLAKDGKSSRLAVPLQPGTYGVALAHGGTFHHLQTFEVTPVTATLGVPRSVAMNATFEIEWTGPAYSSDVIAIAHAGADRRTPAYTYPGNSRNGTTVALKAPLEPGDYDVIYLMKNVVLAREPLTVGRVNARVNAAETVQAGGELEIQWIGPDNRGDLISLIEKGATTRSSVYGYTGNSAGNRLVLVVPEVLGHYDVIYFTGGKPLARRRRKK